MILKNCNIGCTFLGHFTVDRKINCKKGVRFSEILSKLTHDIGAMQLFLFLNLTGSFSFWIFKKLTTSHSI